jgi:5-(carboxyamino)imidazole ribonucleotide synthase
MRSPQGPIILGTIPWRPMMSVNLKIMSGRFAGLPLGFPGKPKAAVMVNLLGEGQGFVQLKNLDQALKTPGLSLHLYGKTLCRPGRKMGHYTLVGEDLSKVLLEKSRIKPLFKVVGEKK